MRAIAVPVISVANNTLFLPYYAVMDPGAGPPPARRARETYAYPVAVAVVVSVLLQLWLRVCAHAGGAGVRGWDSCCSLLTKYLLPTSVLQL